MLLEYIPDSEYKNTVIQTIASSRNTVIKLIQKGNVSLDPYLISEYFEPTGGSTRTPETSDRPRADQDLGT